MSNLPTVTSPIPNDLRMFLNRVRETLGSGDLVTREQLIQAGLLVVAQGGTVAVPPPTTIRPPAPTGLTANGALSTIMLVWDDPGYDGHAYTEIWRAATNDIGQAQPVGQAPGRVFADAVGGQTSVFYWIRFVSTTNDEGPFNGTAGTPGAVSLDPTYLMNVLSADTPNALMYTVPTDTVVNGIPIPAGVYLRQLYLANGSVTNLKIGKEAVEDSNIKNLSAEKVTFGEMDGDRIKANTLNANRITASSLVVALAAIQQAYVGTANIDDATITNAKLTGPIYSANYVLGVSGWRLDPDGNFYANSGQFRGDLQSSDFQSGSRGWRLTKTGSFELNGPGGTGRLTITNNLLQVFDNNNVLRVRLGLW